MKKSNTKKSTRSIFVSYHRNYNKNISGGSTADPYTLRKVIGYWQQAGCRLLYHVLFSKSLCFNTSLNK